MANPSGNSSLTVQAWNNMVTPNPIDNIFDEYSQLKRMESGKSFKGRTGGDGYIGTIEYAVNTTVESITPSQTISTANIDVFDQWSASGKQYAGTYNMTSFEQAANRGDRAKFDLEKGKLKNIRQSMRKRINEDIFGATANATDLSGLQTLVPDAPTTGTRQGISALTYSFWRSQQTLGTQTTSAYDNLRSSMRTIRTACAKGQGVMFPEYYVTGPTTANGYESILVANERIGDKKDTSANAAFSGDVYYFGNAKVFWDDDCADSRMYALNYANLTMQYQTGYWFKGYDGVDPANQLLTVFKVETQAQLTTDAPLRLGVITEIT